LVFVGSSPKWLRHPVATNLGLVVVEEVTATLVSISQQLWEPVAAHLGLGVVKDRAAALDVGKSQHWNSVAADLVLAVVSPVSAAFIASDGSYWKRDHKLIAAHEELGVVRQSSATGDLEIEFWGGSKEWVSIATDVSGCIEGFTPTIRKS